MTDRIKMANMAITVEDRMKRRIQRDAFARGVDVSRFMRTIIRRFYGVKDEEMIHRGAKRGSNNV